ncbi:hypothetical protein [Promicromonospora sp. NPDC050249]|uniref:hypothetical protein n=1 Tax=Promicromonospora sp. NPDC050249 TaxID=3154743 RepID=UPI0033E30553
MGHLLTVPSSLLAGPDRVIDGTIIGPPPREAEARLYLAGPRLRSTADPLLHLAAAGAMVLIG